MIAGGKGGVGLCSGSSGSNTACQASVEQLKTAFIHVIDVARGI